MEMKMDGTTILEPLTFAAEQWSSSLARLQMPHIHMNLVVCK